MLKPEDRVKILYSKECGKILEITNSYLWDYNITILMDDGSIKMFNENQLEEI